MRTRGLGIPAMVLVFSTFAGVTNAADIALTDEGRTIVYTSRKWETPASVAEKFGVAPEDVPAFLEANGITRTTNLKDPIKYRVPNPLVRREQRAEERATTAEHELAVARERTSDLEGRVETSAGQVRTAEAARAHLVTIERYWPLLRVVAALLAIALIGVGWFAFSLTMRLQGSQKQVRVLIDELEDKRHGNLAERQESARKILTLENRVRELEGGAAAEQPARASGKSAA